MWTMRFADRLAGSRHEKSRHKGQPAKAAASSSAGNTECPCGSRNLHFSGKLRIIFEKCLLGLFQFGKRRLNVSTHIGYTRHQRVLTWSGAIPGKTEELP